MTKSFSSWWVLIGKPKSSNLTEKLSRVDGFFQLFFHVAYQSSSSGGWFFCGLMAARKLSNKGAASSCHLISPFNRYALIFISNSDRKSTRLNSSHVKISYA